MKISLLHATRGTPDPANATRESWLSRASHRSMIEHFWAIQAGDTTSTALDPDSIVAVTDDPPAWASSSVANWNAAAALATGDLLVVITDDLTPPIGWDETLRVFLGNPNTASTQSSTNLTMPPSYWVSTCRRCALGTPTMDRVVSRFKANLTARDQNLSRRRL